MSSIQRVKDASLSERISPEELVGLYKNMCLSRLLDDEEIRLKKRNLIFFQVSSAGHEAIGVAAASLLRPGQDWFFPYYRDRAMCLQIGLSAEEMLLSAVGAESDPISAGRQMPAHWSKRDLNIVTQSSPTGTQFNQAVGVAEAGRYARNAGLPEKAEEDEVVLACSGEGATSEGEFWEALNVAANRKLPVLFLIEDNEYAISVPVEVTTAGGSISRCFEGMPNMKVMCCDGTNLMESLDACEEAVDHIRGGNGPVLLHAKVTRPYSHSLSDDQIYYRTKEELEKEKERDCLIQVEKHLIKKKIRTALEIEEMKADLAKELRAASAKALEAPKPDPKTVCTHLFSSRDLTEDLPKVSGLPRHGGEPIAMAQAINRTLKEEMGRNERILVFGEDVADASREEAFETCKGKGGVFKVTYGLQKEFGSDRVYNTLLAEASIIGRAIGMAARGLKPVPEIQFFDFIWPGFNQIRSELASFRWRSAGDWGAPAVVRVPIGGYLRGGSIYHSQSAESIFISCPGLKIAYPSNAADAMGLLRAALRMDDPVMFFEHKHLYLSAASRSPDPGFDHIVPFGKAAIKRSGTDLTLITWGALVHKSLEAAEKVAKRLGVEVEVVDLRTLVPMDRETVLASVQKTGRALVVHEEPKSCGFGGQVAALLADECFEWLDAPIKRVAGKDAWVAYTPVLEEAMLPSVGDIVAALEDLAQY